MKRYYLAYGSNLNVGKMGYRCPTATIVGTAVIKDYRLMFKGSKTGSYLTIEKAVGHQVPVAVWCVTENDELSLDRYEGFPYFYYKKEMELDVKGIKTGKIYHKNCFVYIMHEDRKLGIPSRHYVQVCLEGYKVFGFDVNRIKEALEFSMEE